jgi:type II secretory pathway pseudopilin PulG
MNCKNKIFSNEKGAVVISTLIIISVMIVIMVGIASVQILTIAKDSSRANEALEYLDIMEEMGQVVARARQLGKGVDNAIGTCPPGTTAFAPIVGLTLCLPGAGAVANVCISRTNRYSTGQNVCLEAVTVVSSTAASAKANLPTFPDVSGVPAAASTEPGTPSVTLNTTYHSDEPWFPKADTTAWPAVQKNEIRTPLCGVDAQYWLGCIRCNTNGVTCLEFKICPPGVAAGCANPYVQRIAVW